jgi:hypothetical protein
MAKENFSGGLNSLLEPQGAKEAGAGRTKSTKKRNY